MDYHWTGTWTDIENLKHIEPVLQKGARNIERLLRSRTAVSAEIKAIHYSKTVLKTSNIQVSVTSAFGLKAAFVKTQDNAPRSHGSVLAGNEALTDSSWAGFGSSNDRAGRNRAGHSQVCLSVQI